MVIARLFWHRVAVLILGFLFFFALLCGFWQDNMTKKVRVRVVVLGRVRQCGAG